MIIGLTGTKGSGKGEISKNLKERGFIYSSLSDRVREEAKGIGLTDYITKDLQDIGDKLRRKYGNSVLAKITMKNLSLEERDHVIDGIRNTGEIEYLRELGDFILIAIDSKKILRFNRIIRRNRSSDIRTWEDFLEIDKRDLGFDKSKGQEVKKCINEADYKINNNGNLSELYYKINKLLRRILI
ncbi:MAG: AAA family ATPase [Candidatus Pacearchaeota archaeon]|jgi:dephospho-CoA kinase|nr:hypothetical protein [Candidatus Pacearchaeota archaeon]MDP7521050.1 AAA family ATPase [Candidatus Pacearchaeota archaeon]|tara:strand:- start:2174 stop:2728 length:555 start_codon:yes stop_codon:yes gene_type:complete